MLPQQTDKIFETLSKGKFICENYPDSNHRQLYSLIYDHYDELYDYFSHIGYQLHKEQEYFYFAKDNESAQNIENKLKTMLNAIDLLDFILEFQNDFGVNSKVSPNQILQKVNENTILKNKLSKLDKRDTTLYQKCKKVLEEFVSRGIMAIENEEEEVYIALSSFKYLEKFINSIQEISHEH